MGVNTTNASHGLTRRQAVATGLAALGCVALPRAASAGLVGGMIGSKAVGKSDVESSEPFPVVEFGSYPQSADGGPEPIEWYVIADEGRRLLLSKHVLDRVPYNEEKTSVTWEECTLRAWLNGEFLQTAFTEEERSDIGQYDVENEKNPEWGTPGGNVTVDRVFCVSIGELEVLLGATRDSALEELVGLPTGYALGRGLFAKDEEVDPDATGGSFWWLRSSGSAEDRAAYVDPDGCVRTGGWHVNDPDTGVRPALWLNA